MFQRNVQRHLLFLCGFLLSLYLLAYVSVPGSADGEALLATAVTTVQHGSPDIVALGASEALLPEAARMGQFGAHGLLYSKKGPTPSLLLVPLVALADLLPWLSLRATAMLFNPLITTLTTLAIYALARRMRYGPPTALVTALLFGTATFALNYVKTLFGEPLAGLLVLASVAAAYRYRQHSTLRALALAGTALGLATGINLSYVAMGPVIGLYIFGWDPRRWLLRHVTVLAAPVAIALLLIGGYNWARFGTPLDSGYNFAAGEGFNRPFFYGVYGLLLSPYKGVFWYNPILLLAIPGWWMLHRRESRLAWVILALITVQIATYASWWSWHGGVTWGPRFLLPVTPLAALCLTPVIERAMTRRVPWLHVTVVLLAALSIAIQLLGTLYSYFPHYGYLLSEYGTGTLDGIVSALDERVMTDPATSPILGHIALVIAGWDFEPVWLRDGVDGVHLGAALLLGLVSLLALHPRISQRASLIGVALVAVISLNAVAARQQRGDSYDRVRAFEDAIQPPDMVVTADTQFGSSLIDVENGARVMLTNAPTTPDDPLTAGIWDYALSHSERLWFVSWFPPGHPDNWQEYTLWMQYPLITERTFSGYRAVYFDLDTAPEPDQPGGWTFGPLQLASYGQRVDDRGVTLTVAWQAGSAPESDYSFFIHLIDANGTIIAQQDRAPLSGYAPTSTWQAGDTVQDRLHFPLSAGTDTTGWQICVGFVDPQNGERLPTTTPDDQPVPDGYILLPVEED